MPQGNRRAPILPEGADGRSPGVAPPAGWPRARAEPASRGAQAAAGRPLTGQVAEDADARWAIFCAATGRGLVLHEGISDPAGSSHAGRVQRPDPAATGCPRWPESLRLLSSQGELVRGRCRATNLCDYCARLAAVENAELLALDALHGTAPAVWVVLTTRTTCTDPKRFYRSRDQVLKALKRRWPAVEAAWLLELTTGFGPKSGGKRRPHWNALLKGIDPADVDEVRDVVTRIWCAREDAEPQAQHVGTITEAGGLMRYLALHFQKESQAPPKGWRGHRFSHSRGYLWTTTPDARRQARHALQVKRELHKAIRAGHTGPDVELRARDALAIAGATSWSLVHVLPTDSTPERPSERMRRLLGAGRGSPPLSPPFRGLPALNLYPAFAGTSRPAQSA